jgi:lysophospholipase L1-like esterase
MSTPQLSRKRLALFWAISAGLGLLLLICGSEILIRLALAQRFVAETDAPLVRSAIPGLGYQLAPNWHGSVETDSRGLRARTADPVQPRRQILLIGDSVAFGSAVRYEHSFGPNLEALLTKGLGQPVAVWNAAVPGYNTTQEALALGWAGPLVKPDLIVVQVCMNDYMDRTVLSRGGTLDATRTEDGGGGFSLTRLLYRSRLFVLVKEKLKDQQKLYPESFPPATHYVTHLRKKSGWVKVRNALLQMKQQAAGLNARLLVVVFPIEEQLRIPDRTVQDDLLQFTKQNGIEMLDLYGGFKDHWRSGFYVDYWEQAHQVDKLHLNEKGYEYAAKLTSDAILARIPEYFTQ